MTQLTEIQQPIKDELAEFQRLFSESLTSSNPLLMRAIRHIKQGSGKMMRPILVLLLAKLYGSIKEETYRAAVSLELLHTASLVHDDVVDESDQRRGQLSVNALFNNKVSVLVGDYLLATSLVQVGLTRNSNIVDVVAALGQKLSDGEILQLSNVSNRTFSEEVYFDVIYKKTGALFAACARVAALSVGAPDRDVENATLFGKYLGICFQIKDDIFDYSDSRSIGKPTGNDMLEGKLTLPALFVLNNTTEESIKNLAYRIKGGEASISEIQSFIAYIRNKGGIEYAESVMMDYRDKALSLIKDIDQIEIKNALKQYLDYIVLRRK